MLGLLIGLFMALFGLYEQGAPPAGSGNGGEGAGEGAGAGAAPAGTKPDGKPAAGEPAEPMIPKARLDEVLAENRRLKEADDKRKADALKAAGQHEQLAAEEKVKREKAEATSRALALRTAFTEKAVGKVVDIAAAYRLADLGALEVDEDGNVKGDVGKIIEATVAAYPFLKPGPGTHAGATDQSASGAGGSPVDISKLSTEELIRRGAEEGIRALPPARQGAFGRQGE